MKTWADIRSWRPHKLDYYGKSANKEGVRPQHLYHAGDWTVCTGKWGRLQLGLCNEGGEEWSEGRLSQDRRSITNSEVNMGRKEKNGWQPEINGIKNYNLEHPVWHTMAKQIPGSFLLAWWCLVLFWLVDSTGFVWHTTMCFGFLPVLMTLDDEYYFSFQTTKLSDFLFVFLNSDFTCK